MTTLKGKFPHTHFAPGKRIFIVLRDGTEIEDKFVERRARFLITDNHRIETHKLKSVIYAKHKSNSTSGD